MSKSATAKYRRLVEKEAKAVQEGDLYQALKYVGDDFLKVEVVRGLEQVLDEDTLRKVTAVFKIAVNH